MSIPPKKFREVTLQVLFCLDQSCKNDLDQVTKLLSKELKVSLSDVKKAAERAEAIQERFAELDETIQKYCLSYKFARIQQMEKNILRIGCYELQYDPTIPHAVVISEGVRLAKKFASSASGSFVNAVLDAIRKVDLENELKIDPVELQSAVEEMNQEDEKTQIIIEDLASQQEDGK